MDSKHWQEQFKDELRSFVSTFQKVDGGRGMLASAIERQVVPEEVYLNWARDTSFLPLLKLSYFSDQPIQKALWLKWERAFPWSQDCLPFAEWDGHVFVACLEQPQFPENFPGIAILCPMSGLDKIWKAYQEPEQVHSILTKLEPASVPAETPAKVPPEAPGMVAKIPDLPLKPARQESLVNFEMQKEEGPSSEENSQVLKESEASEQENPDGFVISAHPVKLEKIELKSAVPAVSPPPPPPIEKAAALAAEPSPKTPQKETLLSQIAVSEESEIPTPKPVKPALKEDLSAKAPLSKKPVSLVPETNKPIPAPPQPVAASLPLAVKARPTERSTANGHESYLFEMIAKEKPDAFQNASANLFRGMKEHFKNSIVLGVDSKMQFAKPIIWDQGIENNPKASLVNLKIPSIFRIAHSTQKPFHGPISLNEVNEKFFEDWNHNAIPGHVTIIPMMNGDRVSGLVLGIGEPTAYTRAALQAAEKYTLEFTSKLIPPKATAAS